MRGLVQQMTFISSWSNESLHRNSLGLDLKPTTKLIFELECIMLFNLNQFKRIVHHLLLGGNNLPNHGTLLTPFSVSQIMVAYLNWVNAEAQTFISIKVSRSLRHKNFNKAKIIAKKAQRLKQDD